MFATLNEAIEEGITYLDAYSHISFFVRKTEDGQYVPLPSLTEKNKLEQTIKSWERPPYNGQIVAVFATIR